jgi:hypothetical protein
MSAMGASISLHYSPIAKNLIMRESQKIDCFLAISFNDFPSKDFDDFLKSS